MAFRNKLIFIFTGLLLLSCGGGSSVTPDTNLEKESSVDPGEHEWFFCEPNTLDYYYEDGFVGHFVSEVKSHISSILIKNSENNTVFYIHDNVQLPVENDYIHIDKTDDKTYHIVLPSLNEVFRYSILLSSDDEGVLKHAICFFDFSGKEK